MVVVTGANGFIGSYLVHALNGSGVEDILAVDYVSPQERPQPLKSARYEQFMDPDAFLSDLGSLPRFSAIYHMGACSSTTETDWQYLKKVNLDYSKGLFSFCAEKEIPFYYASSGAVYGDGKMGFDDSTAPTTFTPLNLYGKSKRDFDIWVLEQKKTPPVWAGYRFFNVYGPNEYHKGPMASVVFKAFRQISESGRLKLFKSHNPRYPDGGQLRDFVYVKDICQWMMEVAQMNKQINNQISNFSSGIYNMGFGEARTWLDLAGGVFKALEKPIKIDWIDIPENIRDQYQYFTEANIKRLLAQGAHKPQWSIEKGVDDYVRNFLIPIRGDLDKGVS